MVGLIRKVSGIASRMAGLLIRLILAGIVLITASAAGFVAVKGSQPLGALPASDGSSVKITSLNYWQLMSDSLHASSQTPANCHRTRLIFLSIALPVYPALYTYAGLFPESILAQHMQPNPLIPGTIGWKDIPDTWRRLVVEISWLAFTQPLLDFTPAVGQRVGMDERCVLMGIRLIDQQQAKMKKVSSTVH